VAIDSRRLNCGVQPHWNRTVGCQETEMIPEGGDGFLQTYSSPDASSSAGMNLPDLWSSVRRADPVPHRSSPDSAPLPDARIRRPVRGARRSGKSPRGRPIPFSVESRTEASRRTGSRAPLLKSTGPGYGQPYSRRIPIRDADRSAEQQENAICHGGTQP
jgi:hypothetical protein